LFRINIAREKNRKGKNMSEINFSNINAAGPTYEQGDQLSGAAMDEGPSFFSQLSGLFEGSPSNLPDTGEMLTSIPSNGALFSVGRSPSSPLPQESPPPAPGNGPGFWRSVWNGITNVWEWVDEHIVPAEVNEAIQEIREAEGFWDTTGEILEGVGEVALDLTPIPELVNAAEHACQGDTNGAVKDVIDAATDVLGFVLPILDAPLGSGIVTNVVVDNVIDWLLPDSEPQTAVANQPSQPEDSAPTVYTPSEPSPVPGSFGELDMPEPAPPVELPPVLPNPDPESAVV
jgi:hypothetical protein